MSSTLLRRRSSQRPFRDPSTPCHKSRTEPRTTNRRRPHAQTTEQVAPNSSTAPPRRSSQKPCQGILDALMPQIQNELAPKSSTPSCPKNHRTSRPQLVDSLMPKIHADVVPAVLDDIVDDLRCAHRSGNRARIVPRRSRALPPQGRPGRQLCREHWPAPVRATSSTGAGRIRPAASWF